MVTRIIAMVALWAIALASHAVPVLQAMVDRQTIGINETVQLVIKLSGGGAGRPDLSDIYQDFSIDSHSQSSSARIVNGILSQDVSWTFVLSPNRTGELTIPALTVGGVKSQAISITVTDTPTQQVTNDDVLMEVEVSPLHPYIQGQVIYIQRLYFSRPLVDNASISSPRIVKGKADIEFLGSSNPVHTRLNGRPYQRISRYYAVYPQEVGPLEFAPSVFRGSLARSTQRDPFQYFPNSGTRVSASSAAASVDIEAKPSSFTGNEWLAASQVSLSINWSMPPEALQAGEPVTVTIALIAEGKRAETLPEIQLSVPDAIKVYPEKPVFQNQKSASGIGGMRQETIVLVANQNGEYTIPAVEIPWWDTKVDEQKVARLDPVTIKVSGAAIATNTPPVSAATAEAPVKAPEPAVTDKQIVEQEQPTAGIEALAPDINALLGQWMAKAQVHREVLAAGIGASAVLIVGLIFLRRRRRKQRQSPDFQHQQVQQAATADLIAACNKHDSTAAIAALPAWAASVGVYPATLAGIEACDDTAIRAAVRELSAARYARQDAQWNGRALKQAVQAYGAKASATSTVMLRPLHPISH